MNLYDIVNPMTMDEAKATKTRLDAKCWHNKKIGKPATKVKNGVRVNNCVPKESVQEDNFHGSQDDWHAGDNAWSSENHEMFEGHSFSNGDQVELKPEYADKPGEVYTVSQCDVERGRCWIGDADGRGWYANFNQLIPAVTEEYAGNGKDTELKNVDPTNHSQGEGDFVKNQLHTMKRVITHLDNAIGNNEDLPDWVQSEIAQATDKIVGVMDYSISSKEQDIGGALMKEGADLSNLTPDEIKGIGMMVQNGHDIPTIIRIFDNKPTAEQIVAIHQQSQGVTEDGEGTPEGLPHLTKELLTHIVQQVGTEGAHAIIKSLEWGDGAAEELLALILKDLRSDLSDEEIAEHIGKVKGGYRLYSHKGKNLGTFPSKAGAEKHEREVQYFKHAGESVAEGEADQVKRVVKQGIELTICVLLKVKSK